MIPLDEVVLPDWCVAKGGLRGPQALAAIQAARAIEDGSEVVLFDGDPGVGKCLGRDTQVLMFDGSIKVVQDILAGDLLMGPDSMPRLVLTTTHGVGPLYRVVPTKGESYVVNDVHILSLKRSGTDNVVNLSVQEFINKGVEFRHRHKGWRTGVEWPHQNLPVDPYILGIWLGDGHRIHSAVITNQDPEILSAWISYGNSIGLAGRLRGKSGKASTVALSRTYKESRGGRVANSLSSFLRDSGLHDTKHIPKEFLINSRENRLKLLAGLIDTDGSLSNGCFDIIQKSSELSQDIAFLARSLGFSATLKACRKTCTNNGRTGSYYRVIISGDIAQVPVRVEHKKPSPRKQKKNPLLTGISVESIGVGEYFGFSITGDRLFLLGDFTVTHNTLFADVVRQLLGRRMVYVAPYILLQEQFFEQFPAAKLLKGRARYFRGDDPYGSHFPYRSCGDCHRRQYCGESDCDYQSAKKSFLGASVGVVNISYWIAAAVYLGMFDRRGAHANGKGTREGEWTAVAVAWWNKRREAWEACDEDGETCDIYDLVNDPEHCDGCGIRRERKIVYVVRDASGRQLQLASSCIEEYRVTFSDALVSATKTGHAGWHQDHLTVFDEGDLLEGQLLGFLEWRLSNTVARQLGTPPPPRRHQADRWPEWLAKQVVPRLASALAEAETALSQRATPEAVQEHQRFQRLLQGAQAIRPDWIYQPDKSGGGATWKPITVAPFAAESIWPRAIPALVQSATILHPEQYVADLGLEGRRWTYLRAESGWDPRRRPIYRVRTVDVVKRHPEEASHGDKRRGRKELRWEDQPCWERLVASVAWVCERYPDERTLVHTQSYELTAALETSLTERLGARVLAYYDSNAKEDSLEEFRETPGGVLLAPSMTRGYDLPNGDCRNIVVPKFPWGNLGDKQVRARANSDWRWYRLCAVRELVQALGRANRHALDWARIWLIDAQFDRIWRERDQREWFPAWVRACMQPPGQIRDTVGEALREELQQVRARVALDLLLTNPQVDPDLLQAILEPEKFTRCSGGSSIQCLETPIP